METVLMAIAVVKNDDKILLRKTDPNKNPYDEPWALFGGRIEGNGSVKDLLNKELLDRWNFTISITDKPWWDEDSKKDHDAIEKRFIYIDCLCKVASGEPIPVNQNEQLEWVPIHNLSQYPLNPPTLKVLSKLGYINK